MIEYNGIIIQNLTHATVEPFCANGIKITMNTGYVFWDKRDYTYNGVYEEPAPEDICYSRSGYFPITVDFSTLMEAVESEVPADQIFGKNNEETI